MNTKILKKYFVLGLLTITSFVIFIYFENSSVEYSFKVNSKASLSAATIQYVQELKDDKAVMFEVYSNKNTLVANKIQKFFMPYLRINNKLQLKFVDPITNPSKVKDNAITMQGEILLINLQSNKQVHITELSESAVTNAIIQLENDKNEWIIFAEGFGMPKIDDESAHGLSTLLIHLKKLGYHIARMPLNESLILPENVKLIVLPAPDVTLNNKVVAWLQQQSDKGISIWWLDDVTSGNQMNLELMFDVIAGSKKYISDDADTGLVSKFPEHAITENFNQPIYLAEAVEIIAQKQNNAHVFIQSQLQSPLAIAQNGQNNSSRQVVTGDYDFISNQYINSAANKSLIIRIIDWLMFYDNRVNIPVQVSKNTQLLLSQTQLIFLSVFLLLLLPLVFLIMAIKQWRSARS